MLDWFHQFTGLPWWLVIASSTLVMRIALLPTIIVERKKLKRIGELLPKLPPPPWMSLILMDACTPHYPGSVLLPLVQRYSRNIWFKTSSGWKVLFGLLSEEQLKPQLSTLMLPIFLIGYCVHQGSLVYWVTNRLINIVQELALNYPCVCAELGLPDKNNSKGTVLSPRDLSNLSIKLLSEGHKQRALHLLKLALEKDPEYVRALILMGQTLSQSN
ncbi:hypothetical protein M0R45_027076 [Rubus argutus]|uniref:Uncharacterized protein n=1 Tax=Rubus argutus TaxID=59490 RepID=A0AAW1WZH4_RUBAR